MCPEEFFTESSHGPAKPDALDDVIVWTPAIERLGKQVGWWVRMDSPGGIVYGKPRTGKSAACSYLAATLQTIIGCQVIVVIWRIQGDALPRERDFVQERLQQSGCAAVMHRDIAVLRTRLYDHIARLAAEGCAKRTIIIVDDAQQLAHDHYSYLVHCFDELVQRQLRPFFLLVGQPELKDIAHYWSENQLHQIVGRFYVHQFAFKGVAVSDISEVLEQFDQPTMPGRPSVPASILAGAYAEGWRLHMLAPLFGEALAAVSRQHNLSEEILIPMQYLRSTVLAFLSRVLEQRIDPHAASAALVMKCLRDAGFLGVIGYYSETPSSSGNTEEGPWDI
ncbi:ATP-binding protein [Ralstonia sp. 22111]|uniref:ATP-binding protein n=1 Tax=Ralstonia sp. 22111 TaxID=3453878 RepID=UPI003F8536E2